MARRRSRGTIPTPRPHREDDEMRAELQRVVEQLPPDSPAAMAFQDDRPTPEIMRLIPPDRRDLLDPLSVAYTAWHQRSLSNMYTLSAAHLLRGPGGDDV